MWLAWLLSCVGGSPAEVKSDACLADGLVVEILSPAAADELLVGEPVALEASGTGGAGDLLYTWTLDGVQIATGASATWTPDESGTASLVLTATDDCAVVATHQRALTVRVSVPSGVTVWADDAGVPDGSWTALSVAPDGGVWAAGSQGLLYLDPEAEAGAEATRIYGLADGLLSDTPYAVLAHSDGTVWVGHVATIDRQGEHVSVGENGDLTVLTNIDYIASDEIAAVFRMREQPFGAGAGDVWMGTNEGLCLYDADLGVFDEHAHPTHPHGYTLGVAVTADANIWNADAYQVSRWNYSDDGSLSSSDLVDYFVPWPVDVEVPISSMDADAFDQTVWVVSSLYGVARLEAGEGAGATTVELMPDPWPLTAGAVRADGAGHVWIGTSNGLYVYDEDADTLWFWLDGWLPSNTVDEIAVDSGTSPPTVWLATRAGFVEVVGLPDDGLQLSP